MKEIDSDRSISYSSKSISNYQTCKAYNAVARLYIDNLIFKPVKDNTAPHAPPALSYSKSYTLEHSELLYKLLKCDARLWRSILEASGKHIKINIYRISSHRWTWLERSLDEQQRQTIHLRRPQRTSKSKPFSLKLWNHQKR